MRAKPDPTHGADASDGPARSPAAGSAAAPAPAPEAPAPEPSGAAGEAPGARTALLLDDDAARLGRAALHLIRAGVRLLYAKDADEALLLSRQEADRIHAVIAPATRGLDQPAALCTSLERRGGVRPPLVLVGSPDGGPDEGASGEADRARLISAGVAWILPDPHHESALTWVADRALGRSGADEPLGEDWAPARLLGSVYAGSGQQDLVVCALSAQGALLDTSAAFEPESRMVLEIALPDGPITLKGAAHACGDRLGTAVGVRFQPPSPEAAERLGAAVVAQAERLRA